MSKKLSQLKTNKGLQPAKPTMYVHTVDPTDTTDSPEGSSIPVELNSFMEDLGADAWFHYAFNYTDFQPEASNTATIAIALPAGTEIAAAQLKHSAAFTGTGITNAKARVGITGETERFINDLNVNQAAAQDKRAYSKLGEVVNYDSAYNVILTLTTTGADIDTLDAGDLTVSLKLSKAKP